MPHIKIHAAILSKMDAYIKNNNIPNIIFHGPTGSGKKYIINSVIDKLYSSADATALVMYVNCAHGKGIKFIREDLKLFSKTNILNANGPGFKTVVLVNADKLTIDAQSALRRCIELFSHSTRFFISVENIDKLLKPILSRFCDVYVFRPNIRGTETSLYTKKIRHRVHSTGEQQSIYSSSKHRLRHDFRSGATDWSKFQISCTKRDIRHRISYRVQKSTTLPVCPAKT